jgi:hypothetical protein
MKALLICASVLIAGTAMAGPGKDQGGKPGQPPSVEQGKGAPIEQGKGSPIEQGKGGGTPPVEQPSNPPPAEQPDNPPPPVEQPAGPVASGAPPSQQGQKGQGQQQGQQQGQKSQKNVSRQQRASRQGERAGALVASAKYTCAQLQAAVQAQGQLNILWQPNAYYRFVANERYCAQGQHARLGAIQSADSATCVPGYICE